MIPAAAKACFAAALCLLAAGGWAFAACDLPGDMRTLGQAIAETGSRDPDALAALDPEFRRLYQAMDEQPAGAASAQQVQQWRSGICQTLEDLLGRLGKEPARTPGAASAGAAPQ